MDVSLSKAIIHVLNRDMDEPLLNDFELDLEDVGIYNFLEKHISKSLDDENVRKGVFKAGRNITREVSNRAAQEPEYFVEGSKEIARQLFKAMKTNVNIASTDLIIVLYKANDESNIAILKMDYSTTFTHNVEVEDEKVKISIKKHDISLPGVNQKIQKCVFVREDRGQEDYNFIVLDNQMNVKNKEEGVAQFFIETFLDGELVVDDRVRTKIFKKETESWIQKKEKEGEDLGEQVRTVINTIVHEKDEIDVEALSYELFENRQHLREDYVKSLEEKGLTENNFTVDRDLVEKRFTRVRLKTSNNIEINMDYNIFNDKEMFEIATNSDGSKNIIIKNVRGIVQR